MEMVMLSPSPSSPSSFRDVVDHRHLNQTFCSALGPSSSLPSTSIASKPSIKCLAPLFPTQSCLNLKYVKIPSHSKKEKQISSTQTSCLCMVHAISNFRKPSIKCSAAECSSQEKIKSNPPYRLKTTGPIYAIGDLHGDWSQTVTALRMSGLLSTDNLFEWTGESAVLVQLGDVLDRGDEEMAIISFFHYLNSQAKKYGGAVIMLNGNHETMNVNEDFRYVTSGAFEENEYFLNYAKNVHAENYEAAFQVWWKVWPNLKQEIENSKKNDFPWNPLQTQRRLSCRSFLFRPGGPVACQLAENSTILFVNDNLFAHGGVLPHHVRYGLERINHEVSEWMRGHASDDYSDSESDSDSEKESSGIFRIPGISKRKEERVPRVPFVATRGYDSIVWSRMYSLEKYASSQDYVKALVNIESTLSSVQASRLIVGHTPQIKGANCEFDGKVWRIDVGMSSGVLNAHPQVLQIDGDVVRVIKSQSMISKL